MPELSVVVPLEDTRGEDAAEHLRTWTHEQSLPRDRYQVVVASPGGLPDAEAQVERVLSPHDALVYAPGGRLQDLWNAAAERAEGDWLVMTESHCEGDPACLAAIARAVENDPDVDAFTLRHGHIAQNDIAELCARWFDVLYEDWTRPDTWDRLNLVGIAIHRRAFEAMGRLDPRSRGFSAPLLSARLQEEGGRIEHIDDAVVLHVHNVKLADHHYFTMDDAAGECETRTREDRVFCESYFGAGRRWTNRQRYERGHARRTVALLASSAMRAAVRRREEIPWLLREIGWRLPAAVAGIRPYAVAQRLGFRLNARAVELLKRPDELRFNTFLRAHRMAVGVAQLEWIEQNQEPPAAPVAWRGARSVEELDHHTLIGVHGLERFKRRWFRWGEPATTLRFVRPPGPAVLKLDRGGLDGAPLERIRAVYSNGRRIPPNALRADGTWLVAPLPDGEAETSVTVLTRPFEPRRSGSHDPRRLGPPIFAVAIDSL